jgi:hypothetical protein
MEQNQSPMTRCTWNELKENGRKLAEAYKRGDTVCMGIKREEVLLLTDDFAVYAPYIPLQVTPIVNTLS